MIGARVIALGIGYLFGLFQTGYLYGKSQGIDIRSEGSGNAGTTNSLRVLGIKAGLITFAEICARQFCSSSGKGFVPERLSGCG